ncbi:hypothetical protein AB0K21_12790 [Streptosporangium sp. NPDC049248]|uniref:hypothetical protein n=1 Tax=Streptosporangium sp. NPDC049248 TaxID=3155651 RepID=UPI0034451561
MAKVQTLLWAQSAIWFSCLAILFVAPFSPLWAQWALPPLTVFSVFFGVLCGVLAALRSFRWDWIRITVIVVGGLSVLYGLFYAIFAKNIATLVAAVLMVMTISLLRGVEAKEWFSK